MTEQIFNENEWKEKIKQPSWYFEVPLMLEKLSELRNKDESEYKTTIKNIYSFFEVQLDLGNVFLGNVANIWDIERKPIDTIVIHHTHHEEKLTKERLSAIELIRLYAPYFNKPYSRMDKKLRGEPVFSGHIRNDKQIFYPYHWIVRKNGEVEQLLFDNEIGWHAGNWDVNCRSIGIALDGDYENSTPSETQLKAITDLIKEKYPTIKKDMIKGHREINSKTTCPSNLFLTTSEKKGWKKTLLEVI
jgi:hypothetical protein